MSKIIQLGKMKIGGNHPFVLISGPCAIESRSIAMSIAKKLKAITTKLKIPFIFKASYDKANRSSLESYRGPGLTEGLKILKEIKETLDVPVTSDVHCVEEIDQAAEVLDVLQIPAFLCRQTNLILKTAKTGKIINVKKGQFLAPWDMKAVVRKIEHTNNPNILLTERGVSFGYNNLVTDYRSLQVMREWGYPVVFDATHSVQLPGGLGHASGGRSEFVPLLARCAVAAGCSGLFFETHHDPSKALSDGPNMVPLSKMEALLKDLVAIDRVVKERRICQ